MNSENKVGPEKKEQNFIQEIFADAFDLKYGLPQTIWMLFRNPKKVAYSHINREKSHYYSPYKYLMILVALCALIVFLAIDFELLRDETINQAVEKIIIEDGNVKQIAEKLLPKQSYINGKLQNEYSSITTLILWLPIYALISFWFFKKHLSHFKNHFAINAYLIGQVSLMQALLALPLFFLPYEGHELVNYLSSFLLAHMIYYIYAYMRIFYNNRFGVVLKSIFAPIISQLVVILVLELISFFIAFIMVVREVA